MVKYILLLSLLFMNILMLIASPIYAADDPGAFRTDRWPVRDVVMDEDGNMYIIALNWATERPELKVFGPDGKLKKDFRFSLPNFCCEPYPLKIVYCVDGFIYVLLPGKETLLHGTDLFIVRLDKTGEQDRNFGDKGVVTLPQSFKLKDFDVSPEGTIWVLDVFLHLYRFDEKGKLMKVRELNDIFPEQVRGGEFERFYGRNLFAMDDDKILITGNITISTNNYGPNNFHAALELDTYGYLTDHHEWETPWFKKSSENPSFHSSLHGKSFIRDDGSYGSVLGYPVGIREEKEPRGLSILDWSINEGFHFFNNIHLELPKEVYLGYDLNLVMFVRNSEKTILFFPFENKGELLAVSYDKDGKITEKFKLKAFR